MSSPTFISKYKPYYIKDFCVDPKLLSVINTLLEIDDLNILFIGNTNSGKTTLLYALIREYYGLTQTNTFPENNIMFINNLKEQGINYYRNEMKTFCQSCCTIYGKKKLVIVDDLDMINEQSQQVFRNYIDKYKNNVAFISVCTNIQKVIESIQSRIHIIRIQPPTKTQFLNIMDKIICNEQIEIDEPSKQYLLLISDNSIRTMINNIEKIYIYGKPITLDVCKQLCTNISFQLFDNYVNALKNKKLSEAIRILYDIHDYGYSVIDILDMFFTFIKTTDILCEDEKYKIIPFLCKYITIFHKMHEDIIELSLFTNNLYNIF
jgi:DNA polymerase III delta prime subunit